MQGIIKSNERKYTAMSAVSTCGVVLLSGSVLQAFLLEYGVSEKAVSLYVSLLQIAQVLVMLLGAKPIENVKKVVVSCAVCLFFQLIMPLALAFFCVYHQAPVSVMFGTVCALSVLSNLLLGIYNVLCYKLPYHIMPISRYGTLQGISGGVAGVMGVVLSFLLTISLAKGEYFNVMLLFFLVCAGLHLASALLTTSLKEIQGINQPQEKKQEATQSIFRYKPFYVFVVPNLLRGIGSGVVGVAAVIGHSCNLLDTASAGVMTILMQVASIASSFLYSFISRKFVGKIVLWAGLLCVISLPVMLMGGTVWFLAVYCLMYFAFNLVNYDIPVAVTKFVSYEYIGQYSAWRMMLHTLGMAIGSAVTPYLLDLTGGYATLIFAGVCLLFCCVFYYVYIRKNPLLY